MSIWTSVDVFSQRANGPQTLSMCSLYHIAAMESHGDAQKAPWVAYGHAQSDPDDRLTANPGRLAVEPLQQFLQQKDCCRGLYSTHALSHGLISSTTLYNTLQSTALQQFYSLQPLHHPSGSWKRQDRRRDTVWIPFEVMQHVLEFALDHAIVKMPPIAGRDVFLRQCEGIPMGDNHRPSSPPCIRIRRVKARRGT